MQLEKMSFRGLVESLPGGVSRPGPGGPGTWRRDGDIDRQAARIEQKIHIRRLNRSIAADQWLIAAWPRFHSGRNTPSASTVTSEPMTSSSSGSIAEDRFLTA